MATIRYNAAPAFRNTYFDAQGVPLIDGKLYSYKATAHATPKAIYQSNTITPPATTPPAYSNPIILDSGASVGPLFFASDENYYLELTDKDDAVIATVDNWNSPENTDPSPKGDEVDVNNYVIISDFSQPLRREWLTTEFPANTFTKMCLSNWYFDRSNETSDTKITVTDFQPGQTHVPNNPISYVSMEGNIGTGETHKVFVYRIENVNSFSGEDITVSFYARTGLESQSLAIKYLQYFGTGGSAAIGNIAETFTLTSDWAEYSVTFPVPSISGKTVTDVGLNALQIEFQPQLGAFTQFDLSHVYINRGAIQLEYPYLPDRYSNAKAIGLETPKPPLDLSVSADRYVPSTDGHGSFSWVKWAPTGAVMMWMTENVPTTWLELNGGSAQHSLYSDLYDVLEKRYGYEYCLASVVGNLVTVTAKQNGNVTDATAQTSGFTINVTQQGTGALPEIFTIQTVAASSLTSGTYLEFTLLADVLLSEDFYMWISVDGRGVDPALVAKIGIRLNVNSAWNADEVATEIARIMNPLYFRLPDLRGQFVRGWDHGRGFDPDAAGRTDRGDLTVGDHIGTLQDDEFKSHDHDTTIVGVAAPGNLVTGTGNDNNATVTGTKGGNETRPKNIYTMFIIKT